GRVECGEELVGDVGFSAGEAVEERRLAGVGVAHEGDAKHAGTRAPRALRRAAAGELADAILELLHALADQAPVELDLLLARAAGLAEPPALPLEVRPAANEARGQVLEAGELDLQLAFVRTRALREDIEDE